MQSQVYLQNAAAVMIPLSSSSVQCLADAQVGAGQGQLRQQFDIFRSGHTWSMTSLYIMTFGASQASPPPSRC